jgi:hypothetical protein
MPKDNLWKHLYREKGCLGLDPDGDTKVVSGIRCWNNGAILLIDNLEPSRVS